MASNGKTVVFVTMDGNPNHVHAGVKGSHPAWKSHPELHKAAKADKPENWDELSAEVQALYVRALGGESLMFMCLAGRAARGRKTGKVAPSTEPTLEQEAALVLAEAFAPVEA